MKVIHICVITVNLAYPSAGLYKLRRANTLQTTAAPVGCCPYQNLGKGSCVDESGDLPAYYFEVQGYTQPSCQNICDKDDLCTGYSLRDFIPGRLPGCYIYAGGRSAAPSDEIPELKSWAFHLGTGSVLPIARILNTSELAKQYTCMKKQLSTCVVDDVHVNIFDGAQVPLLFARTDSHSASADKWLVKSSRVRIQARFSETDALHDASIVVRAIAVGGSFLKGNVLLIGPLEDQITWNGEAILKNTSSSFELIHDDFFVKARRSNQSSHVEDPSKQNVGVNVALPLGVKLIVNRLRAHINVAITMPPQAGQDGICGSINGVAAGQLSELALWRVPTEESLFRAQRNVRHIQLIQPSMLKES